MVEERNSDYKAEQPEHKVSPLPSPDPFLSPHTCLSLGWALTRLQASGLTEYTLREYRSRNNYTSHTQRKADLMVMRNTKRLPKTRGCALGPPTRQASVLVREEGTCLSAKKKERYGQKLG